MKHRWAITAAIAVISFFSGGWLLQRGSGDQAVFRQARIFDDVLNHVRHFYVDSVPEAEWQETQRCVTTWRTLACRSSMMSLRSEIRKRAVRAATPMMALAVNSPSFWPMRRPREFKRLNIVSS